MLTKNLKLSLLLLLFPLMFISCGDEEATEEENEVTYEDVISDDPEDEPNLEVNVVCMWKAVSLREEPSSKGKYVTTMNLGETGTTYGETVADSSSSKLKEYVKITLGDGTEGWIQKNLTAVDVASYVVKSRTKLYKRPDILATSKKEFDMMQFIVVTETQDDWMKVKGKRHQDGWFSEGWVKSSHLSSSDIDITVAILAERAISFSDKAKKLEALNEITDNADFSGSIFISSVQDMIDELKYEEEEEGNGDEGDENYD